jgi:hypothetical protein
LNKRSEIFENNSRLVFLMNTVLTEPGHTVYIQKYRSHCWGKFLSHEFHTVSSDGGIALFHPAVRFLKEWAQTVESTFLPPRRRRMSMLTRVTFFLWTLNGVIFLQLKGRVLNRDGYMFFAENT